MHGSWKDYQRLDVRNESILENVVMSPVRNFDISWKPVSSISSYIVTGICFLICHSINSLHHWISWCCFALVLGYLEDRRPASNMDPYIVTSLLAETTLLWEPTLEAEALAAQKLALNVWNQFVEDNPLGLKTQSIGTKQPSVWSIFPHLLNPFEKDPL